MTETPIYNALTYEMGHPLDQQGHDARVQEILDKYPAPDLDAK